MFAKKWRIRQEFNTQVLTWQLTCHNSDPRPSWIWRRSETGSKMVWAVTWVKSYRMESCEENKSSWVRVVSGALSLRMFVRERITKSGKVENHIRRWVQSRSRCTGIVIGHLYGSWCKVKFKVPVHLVGLR